MGIPKKALKKSQLEFLTAGPVAGVNKSAHLVSRVNLIENGVKKLGFYKAIDPSQHYSELLALFSVATSNIKRSFQGERSAEERLVFDDEGALVGTLSIAIDGFKPLNTKEDPIPLDPSLKELAIPGTDTLIEKEMIEILFGRYFLDDDDSHPQNIGFAGACAVDIDYDMFWYWFTIWMKEPRSVIGVPKKHVSISVEDWETFPQTKDSKHYHWPAYEHPGEKTILPSMPEPAKPILTRVLPKVYPDPVAFQLLAGSAEAQQQKLAAALKILLTYQPDVLKARLQEQFGNLPLNYTSLGPALSAKYEEEFPHLCNAESNAKPFVDFIMSLYQTHYDSLYRVVVFYMGCDNNGFGVRLPATYKALYEHPSFYKKIKEWIKMLNATLFNKEHSSVQYNEEALKQRYHQVWRDAFVPRLKTLLHSVSNLTANVIKGLSADAKLDKSFVDVSALAEVPRSQGVDDSFTRACQLFGKLLEQLPKEKIMRDIDVDPVSDLGLCLQNLIAFTNELTGCTRIYYDKSYANLTDADNADFVITIQGLCAKYKRNIRMALANTSTYGIEFARIIQDLEDFAKLADFEMHLTTTDEQMKAVSANATPLELPLTHKDTLQQFNEALFLWAKSENPYELTRLIIEIIDTHYTPIFSVFSSRCRTEPVKKYLAASIAESGNNRLAYILSSGQTEDGALNKLLIEHLTPQVLKSNNLISIKKAVQSGAFVAQLKTITLAAVQFAKTDPGFTHLCHDQGMGLFYRTLFNWLERCEKPAFKGIVESALAEYSQQTWWSGRRDEVRGYCEKEGQAKAIALTFLQQGKKSTLNQILFRKIVAAIQNDKSKPVDAGYKLINLYSEADEALYFEKMRDAATDASHKYNTGSCRSDLGHGINSLSFRL